MKLKFWQLRNKLLSFIFLSFIIFLVFSCSLPYLGISKTGPAQSIDYIVVLTGDKGRIEKALEELGNYPNTPLLISGVNSKLSLKDLKPLGINQKKMKNIIRIDYAHNTIENILFILQELKQHPSAKKILLISSDYHLFRIQKILGSLEHSYQFFYQKTDHPFNFKKLLTEGLKNINNFFILLFWNT